MGDYLQGSTFKQIETVVIDHDNTNGPISNLGTFYLNSLFPVSKLRISASFNGESDTGGDAPLGLILRSNLVNNLPLAMVDFNNKVTLAVDTALICDKVAPHEGICYIFDKPRYLVGDFHLYVSNLSGIPANYGILGEICINFEYFD